VASVIARTSSILVRAIYSVSHSVLVKSFCGVKFLLMCFSDVIDLVRVSYCGITLNKLFS
jgi:hypothetical protein